MSVDPVLLGLVAYGHNFFCISTTDARRLAVRALEISEAGDDEADLIDLMNLLWRANRDARRIEESERHVPVTLVIDVEGLPEQFVLGDEALRPSRYSRYFQRQPRGRENYDGFPPPWLEQDARQEHLHGHDHGPHGHEPDQDERRRRIERDLGTAYGE